MSAEPPIASLRVLHVVPTYLPAWRYGGPIRSVHGLCRSLAARGLDVHVATTSVDGDGNSEVPHGVPVEIDGVKVWYFPSHRLRRLYWSPPLGRFLEREVQKFDLLHLHSLFLWPIWCAARCARRHGRPYVLAPRGMLVKALVEKKSRFAKEVWLRLIERSNLENAALVHFTSAIEAEEARRFGLTLRQSAVIANGIDLEDLAIGAAPGASPEPEASQHDRRTILYLGRINWKKGLDRLIPAMRHIQEARLVIAGNDEENFRPALEQLAYACGVADRLTFTGPVFGADKAALLRASSVVVLPSYSENFGNTVLEAMSQGRPVVVTPEVGLSGAVAECGAGLVVPGEPAALGQALKRLLSDPERMQQMGQNGKRAVAERFSWVAVAREMAGVYERLCRC